MEIVDEQVIRLPKDATILCVQTQRGAPCLWFVVKDTTNPDREERTFLMYGTGHERQKIDGNYVGTFQLGDGTLMFHVFEKQKVPIKKPSFDMSCF